MELPVSPSNNGLGSVVRTRVIVPSRVLQDCWSMVCCCPHSQAADLVRPVCANLQDVDLDVPGSDSAETMCNEVGQVGRNLTAGLSAQLRSVDNGRSRQPVE